MKPVFTVKYLDKGIAPAEVEFTCYEGNVKLWNYGDGKFGYYDTPDQKVITHIYKTAGTYLVYARSTMDELSDPKTVIIKSSEGPEPEPIPKPESLWERFINWLKRLLGYP